MYVLLAEDVYWIIELNDIIFIKYTIFFKLIRFYSFNMKKMLNSFVGLWVFFHPHFDWMICFTTSANIGLYAMHTHVYGTYITCNGLFFECWFYILHAWKNYFHLNVSTMKMKLKNCPFRDFIWAQKKPIEQICRRHMISGENFFFSNNQPSLPT